ncbi:MAG: hypothetical protein WBQ10_02495 [Terriglobales bacterium]
MALIASIGLFILSILGAALSGILAKEIEAWSPSIIRGLIKLAVGELPEELRERFSEEWQGYVNDVPGVIGKVIEAAHFLLAARQMARIDRRRKELEGWGQKVAELEVFRSKLVVIVRSLDSLHAIVDSEGIAFPNALKSDVDRLNHLLSEFTEKKDKLTELVSANPPTLVAKVLNLRRRRRLLAELGIASHVITQNKADEIMKKLRLRRRHAGRH